MAFLIKAPLIFVVHTRYCARGESVYKEGKAKVEVVVPVDVVIHVDEVDDVVGLYAVVVFVSSGFIFLPVMGEGVVEPAANVDGGGLELVYAFAKVGDECITSIVGGVTIGGGDGVGVCGVLRYVLLFNVGDFEFAESSTHMGGPFDLRYGLTVAGKV